MQKDPFPAQKSGNVGLDHICVSLSWYSLQYDYDYVKRKAVHMFVWGGVTCLYQSLCLYLCAHIH